MSRTKRRFVLGNLEAALSEEPRAGRGHCALQLVQLIGTAVLGFVVFDNIPDFWTWVGAAVIVCSGLYLGHAERLRYRRRAIDKI